MDTAELPGTSDARAALTSPLVRVFAALQVILVSGVPTQIFVFLVLIGSGSPMGSDGTMLTLDPSKISLQFFALTSLLDTALIAILIRIFLAFSGERSHDVFLGARRPFGEIVRGLALIPLLWLAVVGLMLVITTWLPWLHNVPKNPLEAYMDTPFKAAIFIVVVMLAGGVREELQRAFIIHRFDQSLGGAKLGLAIYSVIFALLHTPQGIDVAILVGGLGVLWGVIYIRRRSTVMAMVSHAGFNAAQVVQQVVLRSLGG